MDDKETREILNNLKRDEDILRYETEHGCIYLVVAGVEDGKVSGQMASPIGVNAISIDELAKKDNLYIAEWKKLK